MNRAAGGEDDSEGQARRAFARGDFATARIAARESLIVAPQRAELWHLLGAIEARAGSPEAEPAFRRAIELMPAHAIWHASLADWLGRAGRGEEALLEVDHAVALAPGDGRGHFLRGRILKSLRREPEAAGALADAARLAPHDAEIWHQLALVLEVSGEPLAAERARRQVLQLEPGHAAVWLGQVKRLLSSARLGAAHAALDAAPKAVRESPGGVMLRAEGLFLQGRLDETLAWLWGHPHVTQQSPGAHSDLIRCTLYDPATGPAGLFRLAQEWNERHGAPASPLACAPPADPARRLRVGFVNTWMGAHNVSRPLRPLLPHFPRGQFEIFLYHAGERADAVTAQLRGSADAWREIAALSDRVATELIRGDRIDILVDMNEHANGGRLGIFARRAAPVQVHWYGNAVTTGVAAMDYRFSDAVAEPPGEADRWSTERIVRLPTGGYCYTPPADSAAPSGRTPALARGGVTFGAIHHLAKYNPPLLALWARLLRELPAARLLLARDTLADEDTRARFSARCAAAGLPMERVELRADGGAISRLGIFNEIDVVLDATPFNGDATTLDALWMGVPVITLAGDRLSARRGASLVTTAGHPDWVVADEHDYCALAVRLAQDPAGLQRIRARLHGEFAASPLCDAALLARTMAAAFREMWQHAVATTADRVTCDE